MHFSYVALLLLAASAAAPALAAPTFEKPRDLFFPVVDSDVSAPLAVRNLDRLGLQSRYDDQDEHLNARNFLTTILSKIDSAAKAIAKVVLVGVDGRDLGLQSEYDDQDKYLNARDFFDSLFNGDVTTGYDLLHGLGIITRSDAQRRDIELLSRYNDLDARSFLDTLFHGFETLGEAALSAAGVPVEVKRRDIELLSRYDDLDARNFWDSLLNGIESIGNPVLAGAGLPVRQDEHLEARADSVKRIVDGLKKVVNEAKAAGFTTDAERRDIKLLS